MANWIQTSAGIAIPTPALESGNVTISTLVDGARNANGKFIGETIGGDKLKIEMSWNILTPTEMRNLLKIWDRDQGGKFHKNFRVYDPRIMDYRTVNMYVGDRSGKPLMVDVNGSGHPRYWTDVQANLIEV